MAENHDQDQNQDQVFTSEQQEIVSKMIEKAVEDATGTLQSNIQGLNRRNNELDRALKDSKSELDKIQREKLSEEERWRLELEQRDQEISKRERELVVKTNREKALNFATENEIPLELIDLVPMHDEDSMMESLGKVKTVVDGDRAALIEAQKKSGGDRPGSGGSGGKVGKKRKSEMTAGEAQAYVNEHGIEAFRALPE